MHYTIPDLKKGYNFCVVEHEQSKGMEKFASRII